MMLQSYIDRVESFSIREKLLVAATVAAFFVSVLQFFLVDPLLVNQSRLEAQFNLLSSNNQRLEQQLNAPGFMPKQTRQRALQKELQGLQELFDRKQQEIRSQTAGLIPADQIPALLQGLINKESVQLVALKNIAPVALLEQGENMPLQLDAIQLYEHGIEIELRGSYHDLRRYLVAIEKQPWKLIWNSVQLETQADGESLMKLEVKTLSMDSAWIGI